MEKRCSDLESGAHESSEMGYCTMKPSSTYNFFSIAVVGISITVSASCIRLEYAAYIATTQFLDSITVSHIKTPSDYCMKGSKGITKSKSTRKVHKGYSNNAWSTPQ